MLSVALIRAGACNTQRSTLNQAHPLEPKSKIDRNGGCYVARWGGRERNSNSHFQLENADPMSRLLCLLALHIFPDNLAGKCAILEVNVQGNMVL